MAITKEQRKKIAAAEAIADTISKRKEAKETTGKEGVDLVGLTEKLAKRRLESEKE